MGVARTVEPRDFETPLFDSIQRDLFAIGGQLAAPDPAKVAKALTKAQIDSDRVAALERAIDRAEAGLPALATFGLPGGAPKAAPSPLPRTAVPLSEPAASPLRDHRALSRAT